MTVSGESGEVREETVQSWKERLPVILAGYSPQDILNMAETGKFYRALPNKSLSEAAKQCRGNNPRRGLHVRSLLMPQGVKRNR